MSNIGLPKQEAVSRLQQAVATISAEYSFLSRYLEEDDKDIYAKAFVDLDELVNVLKYED